eukprot:CAMPEP_0117501212 /NCGR_PEP_ID=MMETSP0784-20121206/23179_1 /TAXON_ID=39447 /ORGANISM="" /LENGTH=57 /DNA_ID=CAMNT_0005296453 /DNA_START=55 /DNA_END=224 /DNA_ORIENTATION=-
MLCSPSGSQSAKIVLHESSTSCSGFLGSPSACAFAALSAAAFSAASFSAAAFSAASL